MTLMDIIVYTRNVQYMIIQVYDLHNQSIRIDYDSFKELSMQPLLYITDC